MSSLVYQFGDFRLDCSRFELTRNGRSISMEKKPLELLILLAERGGQLVTRAEITERLWDPEVFVDTEHGINTAIRKIRHALRDDSEEPQFIQTVMGKGYRFVAPVTVESSPTPEPIPSAIESPSTPEPTPILPAPINPAPKPRSRWRWLAWAIPAILLAAVATTLAARHWSNPRVEARVHSLAVLPLNNLSGDPGQDYFAEGLTDELTTMLARDSTLRVVSRTSAMQFKQPHARLPEIARELNVDGILEGSVERSGNQVHVTLQLIQADTDTHLWAESYDRSTNDLATLPDDVARQIAKLLHRPTATRQARYVNPEAHDDYLHARYLWFTDRIEESGKYYRKATEIQPDYAAAWAGLADYYGEGIAAHVLDPRANMAAEEQAARRALELDPDLAEAHQAMAGVYLIDRWDWPNAEREILKAIHLDPNEAELYYFWANVLEAANRDTEAIDAEKKAMELDPFERPYGLAEIYEGARQYDAALAELKLRMEATPNNRYELWLEQDIWQRKRNYKEAVDASEKWHLVTGDPQSAKALRRAYNQGGARGFVRWQLSRRLEQAKTQYVSPIELASYYGQLGDKDQTLAHLEEGYRRHSTDARFLQEDPSYDFLHNDPRYRDLIHKIGQPQSY